MNDQNRIELIRKNVSQFVKTCGHQHDNRDIEVLDIAPQDHEGAAPYFRKAKLETLDIDSNSNCTYILDICDNNSGMIISNTFDIIICTEVLEHVLQPFDAVKEIYRILKPKGFAYVSTPFNFRIHGPAPDCWRFTEMGLRTLFDRFEILELNWIDEPGRARMPIHYTLIARKK